VSPKSRRRSVAPSWRLHFPKIAQKVTTVFKPRAYAAGQKEARLRRWHPAFEQCLRCLAEQSDASLPGEVTWQSRAVEGVVEGGHCLLASEQQTKTRLRGRYFAFEVCPAIGRTVSERVEVPDPVSPSELELGLQALQALLDPASLELASTPATVGAVNPGAAARRALDRATALRAVVSSWLRGGAHDFRLSRQGGAGSFEREKNRFRRRFRWGSAVR